MGSALLFDVFASGNPIDFGETVKNFAKFGQRDEIKILGGNDVVAKFMDEHEQLAKLSDGVKHISRHKRSGWVQRRRRLGEVEITRNKP